MIIGFSDGVMVNSDDLLLLLWFNCFFLLLSFTAIVVFVAGFAAFVSIFVVVFGVVDDDTDDDDTDEMDDFGVGALALDDETGGGDGGDFRMGRFEVETTRIFIGASTSKSSSSSS